MAQRLYFVNLTGAAVFALPVLDRDIMVRGMTAFTGSGSIPSYLLTANETHAQITTGQGLKPEVLAFLYTASTGGSASLENLEIEVRAGTQLYVSSNAAIAVGIFFDDPASF
jgi:hypothetical protein